MEDEGFIVFWIAFVLKLCREIEEVAPVLSALGDNGCIESMMFQNNRFLLPEWSGYWNC